MCRLLYIAGVKTARHPASTSENTTTSHLCCPKTGQEPRTLPAGVGPEGAVEALVPHGWRCGVLWYLNNLEAFKKHLKKKPWKPGCLQKKLTCLTHLISVDAFLIFFRDNFSRENTTSTSSYRGQCSGHGPSVMTRPVTKLDGSLSPKKTTLVGFNQPKIRVRGSPAFPPNRDHRHHVLLLPGTLPPHRKLHR